MKKAVEFIRIFAGVSRLKKRYKYFFLLTIILNCDLPGISQNQPVNVVFSQDFGHGTSNPAFIGPALPFGKTVFPFSNSACPTPGSYTLVWTTPPASCFNNEWIFLSHDNTPNSSYGMMMVVNNDSSTTNRLVYADTVNENLCPGITYRFSVAIINLDAPAICPYGPDFPVFELRIEDGAGHLIKKDTTRPGVSFAPIVFGAYKFGGYGFDFTIPNGVNRVVPKLTLLRSVAWCAEDFAIDDIRIATVGPEVKIAFDNEPPGIIVKSICFQQNKVVAISGSISSFYSNPALQWQQSTNNGATWQDVPGATAANYSRVFSSPDTFLFRLSAAEAINIANPNCRVVSNSLRIEVDGIPTNAEATNNSPVCAGSDLIFNVTGGASYLWTGPNGFSDNIAFPHIYLSSLSDSGMYYVDITTLGGCHARDSTYAKMIGTDVHAGSDTSICKGNAVQLRASQGISYSWSPPDGLSAISVSSPLARPDVTTDYTVKVTDSHGCTDTAHVQVKVINSVAIKAGISGTDYLCRSYDSASFKDISTGNITKWSWNFGNSKTSLLQDPPTQNYSIANNIANYVVRLAVMDTTGCADTAYHSMKVEDNCYIAVPAAFTPNGDGLNDYLYPLNAYKATQLIFRVFNRNGQLVFETRDWTKKWDGTFKGDPQTTDIFVWELSYTDPGGKKIVLKGSALLIR